MWNPRFTWAVSQVVRCLLFFSAKLVINPLPPSRADVTGQLRSDRDLTTSGGVTISAGHGNDDNLPHLPDNFSGGGTALAFMTLGAVSKQQRGTAHTSEGQRGGEGERRLDHRNLKRLRYETKKTRERHKQKSQCHKPKMPKKNQKAANETKLCVIRTALPYRIPWEEPLGSAVTGWSPVTIAPTRRVGDAILLCCDPLRKLLGAGRMTGASGLLYHWCDKLGQK